MANKSAWPPALKAFVNDTFTKCNDQNRASVEGELKGLIFKAFEKDELWKIDWAGVKLESLNPPQKKRKAPFVPSTPHANGIHPSFSSPSASTNPQVEDDRREKRAKRFEAEAAAPSSSGSSNGSVARRMGGRLVQGGSGVNPYLSGYGSVGAGAGTSAYATPEPEYDPNVVDWDSQTIVGTSTKLEKSFLRLTSVPDPKTIRPLPILRQTLELLKKKWREEANYGYICDQFKSMRQDLTVQRIKTDFTCTVYEIHARIALEKNDLGEFNQCQGQLRELYKIKEINPPSTHKNEFLAYRILYLIFSRNKAELNSTLAHLDEKEKVDPLIVHARQVRQAESQGNYVRFFRLYQQAPKMGAYLMDSIVPRERLQALYQMSKAYTAGISLSYVIEQLAFDSPEEAKSFLADIDCELYMPPKGPLAPALKAKAGDDRTLDVKSMGPKLQAVLNKYSKVDIKGQI